MKNENRNAICLITGAAGFIGFHLSMRLLSEGINVVGFDNMNSYYDVGLKEDRLKILMNRKEFQFVKGDISNKSEIEEVFKLYKPEVVINLAAQAGVRYSIDYPDEYISSNIVGFYNILEACRYNPVQQLIYASSSSVYGNNNKTPFSIEDKTDAPVSLYAATKKSNELMAYAYSSLYKIPATGLRFFTVYGPYGRPDMAYFKFMKSIRNGDTIQIYNNGDMYRDFTYIDDIVEGIYNIFSQPDNKSGLGNYHKVYNIGNNQPEKLMDFISILEDLAGAKAKKDYFPMQPGDVYMTCADIAELMKDYKFKPSTSIQEGLKKFVLWYDEYYKY